MANSSLGYSSLDQTQRAQALDTSQSFIVQAPAGSGKTELLVQRYLSLLGQSATPEAVLAITFTRKAASEMRERILEALANAATDSPPLNGDTSRWKLARKLYLWQQKHQWDLISHPNRLRIQTIDAFYAQLTRQLPLQSGLNITATLSENPSLLYQSAIRRLLVQLELDQSCSPVLAQLLSHLDNNHAQVEAVLLAMLSQRDQWLPLIKSGIEQPVALRRLLEKMLAELRQSHLFNLKTAACSIDALNPDWRLVLHELFAFIQTVKGTAYHTADTEEKFWKNAAELLLTAEGQFRKRLTYREGFPSPAKASNADEKKYYQHIKQKALALLQKLDSQTFFKQHLLAFRSSPPTSYTEEQWLLLENLFKVLALLLKELKAVFKQQSQLDYIEISLAALQALGEEDHPTDLMLALDYQIQHVLVDEFQDISLLQLLFLTRLIAGWETQDGRTLFLVGDPMQSIYRFRKAEVRLFDFVKQNGIGNCTLKFLNLSVNFRSTPQLIHWINQHFTALSTAQQHLPFIPANATETYLPETNQLDQGVYTHWLHEANSLQEAEKVVTLTKHLLEQQAKQGKVATNKGPSIAILGRTRNHLSSIIAALRCANIAYQMLDIEHLLEKPIIQDLLALTRALVHLADETAWLAVLRAPWCGLSLSDLDILMTHCHQDKKLIWDQLCDLKIKKLSLATQQRIHQLVSVLSPLIKMQGRISLQLRVKQAWLALGGPACLTQPINPLDTQAVETFFQCLERFQNREDIVDSYALETALSQMYTRSAASSAEVVVMTIHKAKGLEFDAVILAGLHRSSRVDTAPLLLFEERLTEQGVQLLVAPLRMQSPDPIYQYLYQAERAQSEAEAIRLLYVACTRAKHQLHLVGSLKRDANKKIILPRSENLLAALWPTLNAKQQAITQTAEQLVVNKKIGCNKQPLRRLHLDSRYSFIIKETLPLQPAIQTDTPWGDTHARAIGTVIHQLLYRLTQENLSEEALLAKQDMLLTHYSPIVETLLLQAGVNTSLLQEAMNQVITALHKTLRDPKGRWILSGNHRLGKAEYALTSVQNGYIKQQVIDRMLVDSTHTCWVIDYKMITYPFESNQIFLAAQWQKHSPQLINYARILYDLLSQKKENLRICMALYWPMQSLWFEHPYLPHA